MEERFLNVGVSKGSGTASKTSKRYTLSMPSVWMHMMGVSPEERRVKVSFDGTTTTIVKAEVDA